ncbi:MAG: TauD/TfdA family dioxygenase [Chromatiales bacterium]|nr:TauD/TfdA family dioxygenase [Chromatiales bacterium]
MDIANLSDHTGVAVRGVDLSQPLAPSIREELARLFVERSVLVVRAQQLEPEQLLAAVQNFGQIFVQHNTRFALEECPQIHYLSNKDHYTDGSRYIPGAGYHTDHSNAPRPPKATVLHAVQLPERGGDTQFVNMQLAYESLPPATQRRVEGLKAVHVYQSRHSRRQLMGLTPGNEVADAETVHPIVRVHPESARKALYINPIRIDRIIDMEDGDTLELLDGLLAHATAERHEYRHVWEMGDFVMWDNRSLLHKANGDYDMSQTRYLYRVMLQGDRPR